MKNYGFIAPEFNPEDFWLGSKKLGSQEINPSGDWRISLPRFEAQNKGQETSACVTFTILSNLETLEKFQYGTEPNYSDRWIAKRSGTNPASGNNPKKVCETIKEYGLVDEEDYPFVADVNEYYQEIPDELFVKLCQKGRKWLDTYNFGYEWADINQLDMAIKRSPVSVAVYAWSQNDQEEFVRLAASNHYTLNFVKDLNGKLLVFDSYENPIIKTLAKEHNVEFAQMYTLKKKLNEVEEYKKGGSNWFTQMWHKLLELFYYLF